jgi:hypothetical protein
LGAYGPAVDNIVVETGRAAEYGLINSYQRNPQGVPMIGGNVNAYVPNAGGQFNASAYDYRQARIMYEQGVIAQQMTGRGLAWGMRDAATTAITGLPGSNHPRGLMGLGLDKLFGN